MDTNALFHLESGLYLLSTKGEKDNACIINTVMQVTADPVRITVAINQSNYTHDLLCNSQKLNVSVLTQNAPFSLFSDFGYVSGREKDKFAGRKDISRSANGIYYLTQHSNAYLSAEVTKQIHLTTHTLFLCDITDAVVLSDIPTITYDYYQKNVKPQNPIQNSAKKKGYICEVCGYIYEGNELPEGYICPICKHGTEAFRPL